MPEQGESLKTWAKTDFAGCESYINGLTALGKVSAAVPGSEGKIKAEHERRRNSYKLYHGRS
jgi:hypothetical protein